MVIFQGVLCSIIVQRDGSAKFSGNLVMLLLLYICLCELAVMISSNQQFSAIHYQFGSSLTRTTVLFMPSLNLCIVLQDSGYSQHCQSIKSCHLVKQASMSSIIFCTVADGRPGIPVSPDLSPHNLSIPEVQEVQHAIRYFRVQGLASEETPCMFKKRK